MNVEKLQELIESARKARDYVMECRRTSSPTRESNVRQENADSYCIERASMLLDALDLQALFDEHAKLKEQQRRSAEAGLWICEQFNRVNDELKYVKNIIHSEGLT